MKSLNLNNTKKLVLGLLVAVFAIGFSAFKSATKVDPTWVYVQTDTDEYTRIPYNEFDPVGCLNETLKECSFSQYDNSNNGSPLSHTAVSAIPGIMASTEKGLYDPL